MPKYWSKISPVVLLWSCLLSATGAQDRQIVKQLETVQMSGVIRALKPGQLEVELSDGQQKTLKIQNQDEDALALAGAKVIARLPAEISVSGRLPFDLLEKGMVVRLTGEFNRDGKMKAPVATVAIVDVPAEQMIIRGADLIQPDEFLECEVTGRVVNRADNRLLLFVQKSRLSRQERIWIDMAPEGTFEISAGNLSRVIPGDTITHMDVVRFSTGDDVIKKIAIELSALREKTTVKFHDQLEQKFSHLSDEPGPPRTVKSRNFILYTDVSDRSAQILLSKLETMLDLISRYYGKRPRDVVECFVVADLDLWAGQLPGLAIESILGEAGVTVTRTNGRQAKSIVFSCANHGVVQHEAVHAICSQMFGTPGPIWYAEGMAEMGQYWKPNQLEVAIDPVAIDYLTHAPPKKLAEIVAPGQITGDSWKAYAWRWALCHLLAANSNYAGDFKRLGIGMMQGEEVSFETAFGKVQPQISFEYDQFVANFGSGYRVDLCQWDWKTPASKLTDGARKKIEVQAQKGWQATGVEVVEDESYDYAALGAWKIAAAGPELTADGNAVGKGRLVGAILFREQGEFQLSPAFDLGERGSFAAICSGHLYVRCWDEWTELADNEGAITTHFRVTPEDE